MRRVGPGYRPVDLGITLRLQVAQNGWVGEPIISNAGRDLKSPKAAGHGGHARSVRHCWDTFPGL